MELYLHNDLEDQVIKTEINNFWSSMLDLTTRGDLIPHLIPSYMMKDFKPSHVDSKLYPIPFRQKNTPLGYH